MISVASKLSNGDLSAISNEQWAIHSPLLYRVQLYIPCSNASKTQQTCSEPSCWPLGSTICDIHPSDTMLSPEAFSLTIRKLPSNQPILPHVKYGSHPTHRHELWRPWSQSQSHQQTPADKPLEKTAAEVKGRAMAEMDEELRLKLEGISGEGGEAGLELEDGKAVAMKRGVRENMFRLI